MVSLSTFNYRKKKARGLQKLLVKVTVMLLVCGLLVSISIFHGYAVAGENRILQTVVIDTGDTLWTLAQRRAPRGTDVRDYLDQLKRTNELTSSVVQPGQILELP